MAGSNRRGSRTQAQFNTRHDAHRQIGLEDQVILTGWATPRAGDADKRGRLGSNPRNGLPLQAQMSGWATPTTRDHKDGRSCNVPINGLLGRQVWMAAPPGTILTGSGARIRNGGRLNPALARWLMG